MNTLLNMDPWGFLDEIFDTGSRTFRTMRARAAGRFPPVNVFLDDDAVLIDVELPGKTAADVDLSLEPQAVIIAGKKTPMKAKVWTKAGAKSVSRLGAAGWTCPSASTPRRRMRSSRTGFFASSCRRPKPQA